ncbi:hypothetical protein XH99_10530 [Bradyrhizobium nanningense]|uniref:Uncharacterized protein n=1 Tax=Bradyrhizobium nanningense TaxID=1325118 RepID=A0A4Q0S6M6_9BRAD|nr:hypothetical protein XH99_10530 [Bradyrhizobium nanningense]RXH33170.1 hypothetical protein XH84_10995 [Bradyrhizobium nanningense]
MTSRHGKVIVAAVVARDSIMVLQAVANTWRSRKVRFGKFGVASAGNGAASTPVSPPFALEFSLVARCLPWMSCSLA